MGGGGVRQGVVQRQDDLWDSTATRSGWDTRTLPLDPLHLFFPHRCFAGNQVRGLECGNGRKCSRTRAHNASSPNSKANVECQGICRCGIRETLEQRTVSSGKHREQKITSALPVVSATLTLTATGSRLARRRELNSSHDEKPPTSVKRDQDYDARCSILEEWCTAEGNICCQSQGNIWMALDHMALMGGDVNQTVIRYITMQPGPPNAPKNLPAGWICTRVAVRWILSVSAHLSRPKARYHGRYSRGCKTGPYGTT